MPKGRIYIIPTKFGTLFLVGACIMILVGATYQNNLVNLLAFFMFSLVFVAMVQTHNNLKDIRIEGLEVNSCFAGETFAATFILKNPTSVARFNLESDLRKKNAANVYDNRLPLLPHSSVKLRSAYPSYERGYFTLNEVKLSTVFPLGLFYAWTWQAINASYFIYPEPKGSKAFPDVATGDADDPSFHTRKGGDDFRGHRRFQAGDSPRHVDWKARARGRPLLVKEFNEGNGSKVVLDYGSLEGLDTEARLAQLAKWIEEAKLKNLVFSLKTPEEFFPSNHGLQHATRCLEHLATYGKPAVADLKSRKEDHAGLRNALG